MVPLGIETAVALEKEKEKTTTNRLYIFKVIKNQKEIANRIRFIFIKKRGVYYYSRVEPSRWSMRLIAQRLSE